MPEMAAVPIVPLPALLRALGHCTKADNSSRPRPSASVLSSPGAITSRQNSLLPTHTKPLTSARMLLRALGLLVLVLSASKAASKVGEAQ